MPASRQKQKRSSTMLWPSLLLAIVAVGCGQTPPPDTRAADEAALRSLDAQWSKTAVSRNLDATVAYYSDDATLLPPNAPVATDKTAIRAIWSQLLSSGGALSWDATKVEVARSGDLGYIMGTYQEAAKDPSALPVDTGKFVEVWKKQADGKWKAAVDIFNSDLPVQPAPAPKPKAAHAKRSAHAKHKHSKSSHANQ